MDILIITEEKNRSMKFEKSTKTAIRFRRGSLKYVTVDSGEPSRNV